MSATYEGFWNGIAQKYAASPVADPDAFERKIALTKNRIQPTSTVLDAGCGTGSLALRLAATGAQIHGLDYSSEMVEIAREKARAASVTNVRFHEGPFDASLNSFAPGSLDVVCLYSVLHLLKDRLAALRLAHTLLTPGGSLITSTVCLRSSWLPLGAITTVMRWFGKAPHVANISRKTLVNDIHAAGFTSVEVVDVGATSKLVAFVVANKPV